jgi:AcrR family transcriptional regulator
MSPGRKAWSRNVDVSPGDEGFPFPPWQRPRSEPKTRAVLSRDRIIEVALQIIDAEGTEAVSMRRIATDLGTGAASLYAYVSGKDEVLTLAHELVIAGIDIPELKGDDWQEMVRVWAWQVYRLYARHQDIARLSFAEIPTGPRSLDVTERLFGGMLRSGVPTELAGWLLDRLALYIGADAFEGWMLGRRFAATDPEDRRSPEERGQEWLAGVRRYFGSLPRERYPNLVDNLDAMMSGESGERFGFGLEVLIEGVTSMAAKQQAQPKSPS